jgi:hypothetical protein
VGSPNRSGIRGAAIAFTLHAPRTLRAKAVRLADLALRLHEVTVGQPFPPADDEAVRVYTEVCRHHGWDRVPFREDKRG